MNVEQKGIASQVRSLVTECLNGEAEGALIVEGVIRNYGFSPAKIEEHKAQIAELLDRMPLDFHASGGGGMSFLNLCMDRDGRQWGEHPDMEALIALGAAAGMAAFPLPREMWSILPGGMPYVVFNTATTTPQ